MFQAFRRHLRLGHAPNAKLRGQQPTVEDQRDPVDAGPLQRHVGRAPKLLREGEFAWFINVIQFMAEEKVIWIVMIRPCPSSIFLNSLGGFPNKMSLHF